MDKKVFDVGLAFHLALIRAKPLDGTVEYARQILVDGDKKLVGIGSQNRSKANSLASKIKDRVNALLAYDGASWTVKCELYKSNNSRTPKQGVFDAVKQLNETNCIIFKAATDNGVNFTSVDVLNTRMKRWEEFANELKSVLE